MIVFGITVVMVALGLWLLYYTVPDLGASWWRLQRPGTRFGANSRKRFYAAWVRLVEQGVPHPMLTRLDNLVRLAGKPYGLQSPDWILIELLIALVTWPPLVWKGGNVIALLILGVFLWLPFGLLRSKAKKRRLDAQTQIRAMKRMFRMKLVDHVHIADALVSIGEGAIGEFGDTFRKHLTRMEQSMKIAMQGLRDEYGIPELDEFALALELGEEKTSQELVKELNRQITDEYKHVQNYLDARMGRLKTAQGGAVLMLAVVAVGITLIFAIAGTLHMIGKGGLLG